MEQATQAKAVEILLVEDNVGDADLARDALESSRVLNRLHVVADGVEAMEFLRGQGKYQDMSRPDLILLDLNLPRMDGREVLAEIKGDPDLKSIPVVVLTTSKLEEDVLMTYKLHGNCYITKPIDLEQFLKVVKSIEDFWLTIVKLPSGSRP
jgi:CheY-like chemotaxis protein